MWQANFKVESLKVTDSEELLKYLVENEADTENIEFSDPDSEDSDIKDTKLYEI